jgi:hypothetical protein
MWLEVLRVLHLKIISAYCHKWTKCQDPNQHAGLMLSFGKVMDPSSGLLSMSCCQWCPWQQSCDAPAAPATLQAHIGINMGDFPLDMNDAASQLSPKHSISIFLTSNPVFLAAVVEEL